ncbi:MAG TPA: hypothetical protein VF131_00060 [Blastocatellia bacterium]|nr:hypothetical protein [Blastocatellia bacterium]
MKRFIKPVSKIVRLEELLRHKRPFLTVLTAGSVLLCAATIFAVRAYNRGAANHTAPGVLSQGSLFEQNISTVLRRQRSKLAQQPEADKLRRALGQRFLDEGKERATLAGTLDVDGKRQAINIVRTHEMGGERVEIILGGGASTLTWNVTDGPRAGSAIASKSERLIIERLALDSPDQFVLAQLRAASYRTVARNVVPKGAADIEDYSGPVWDVTLINEPDSPGGNGTLSKSRLYYLSTATGLLEKVISMEDGQAVVAELSGWTDRNGEKLPSRIIWRRNDQIVMELNIGGATHDPRQ